VKALKMLPLLVLLIAVAGFGWKVLNQPAQSSSKLREFPQAKYGTVVRVADGDTLTVDLQGKQVKVRLCGVDAPEQAQPLGKESKALLQKLTFGKEVAVMEIDRDRYGRVVAEVFSLGEPEIYINGDLVQAGLAYHYAKYSKDCINRDVIIAAEAIAKSKKAGVWQNPRSIKPWDYRKNN